ncbi:MAG TPA: serine/threonine-protein kinase [Bryobacteraceae bacterium]|nr:serine/threonine-protein kinase [Bryobacteraceae bacterium]
MSRRLGKYDILQKLGRGGMADVYLAQDTALGYRVALKLIEHSDDRDTRDAVEAERRGAELQAHLAAVDPRVTRIYDCGDVDGFFFVAMEYIDGQDLAELMRRGPLAPEFAADVAIAVAETLENAHNLQASINGKSFQGIVHGDIKPKNIRIDAKGEVRVLDFGIAKALSLSRRLTRNEFGSVPYASPERLDAGHVNSLSDLWSLAVMLYEMLTGLQPYQAGDTERLERMIRSRIPPPPAPDPCPEALRLILIRAMAPDPGLRYQTARAFADDLIAFRQGRPVSAALAPEDSEDRDATRRTYRPPEADEETRRITRPVAPPSEPLPPPKPERPRSGLFFLVMRAIAVLILVGIVYGMWVLTSDYLMYQHGQQLERDVRAELVTDQDKIWNRWTELSKGNPSSLFLYGPRKAVKQKLVSAANRVISLYRNSDSQPVYEKDWERARTSLARALELDPSDDTVRGDLRLCEGQIARINGTAHNNTAQLNDAVVKFGEAQQLMPKSPDPELGLARLYVYGLKDIDKAYDALQQAKKRGYQLGNRENAQLADGYRERADRTWWDSRNVRGLPQEKDQIERAAADYQRALELYQGIAPYGNANDGIVRVENSLVSVNYRLQQISQNPAPAPASAGSGIRWP